MSQTVENVDRVTWKERSRRLLRGAAIAGAVAVGVAVLF